jgi:chemotaxis signal transduction protein
MDSERRAPSLSREAGQTREELLQLVGFHVGSEEFGIDILRVQEIDFATLKWPHFDHYIWPHPNR